MKFFIGYRDPNKLSFKKDGVLAIKYQVSMTNIIGQACHIEGLVAFECRPIDIIFKKIINYDFT